MKSNLRGKDSEESKFFKKNRKALVVGSAFLASALVAGSIAAAKYNNNSEASNVDANYEDVVPAMEWVAKEYAEDFAESIKNLQLL